VGGELVGEVRHLPGGGVTDEGQHVVDVQAVGEVDQSGDGIGGDVLVQCAQVLDEFPGLFLVGVGPDDVGVLVTRKPKEVRVKVYS
jgi:hypothetical protein